MLSQRKTLSQIEAFFVKEQITEKLFVQYKMCKCTIYSLDESLCKNTSCVTLGDKFSILYNILHILLM